MTKKELREKSAEELRSRYNYFIKDIVDCLELGVLGCAISDRVKEMAKVLEVADEKGYNITKDLD